MTKFIFVTGGVVSSLGKGIAASSLGALLQARGYSVRLRKLDPYLNVDPGTMSPLQHGEVYVTEDGTETDLDLGHYERFTGVCAHASDSTTTGKIYSTVLTKERRGDYLGATIQVVPHIIDEIKAFITAGLTGEDFIICEIGGTVGDIEGLPFLEAIRQLSNDLGRENTLFVHLTLLPYIAAAGELKTKPTQHSVKELLSFGIQPDILLCRSDRPISKEAKQKLGLFCNVRPERVIEAQDIDTIYQVPVSYHQEGLDLQVCRYFGLEAKENLDLSKWHTVVDRIRHPDGQVNIAIVGKYVQLLDAYKSLSEALIHAGIANNVHVKLHWLDAADTENFQDGLAGMQGILVPGGFGERGIEGKLRAIRIAREKKIPYLGICLGMQLAVIEAARNLAGLTEASSTEFGPTLDPIVGMMTEWMDGKMLHQRSQEGDLGGTMRLGAYPCDIKEGSLAHKIYGATSIYERHRHRYEVNMTYHDRLESVGLHFTGLSPDRQLPEIIERQDHPWFVGVQFHPELKSRPFDPHPLFVSFVAAAIHQERLV
ncbi:MAG: synthase [Alphaproteobacteria bacterium]|nr:synthase [Alphaproteobacteria bacterium]